MSLEIIPLGGCGEIGKNMTAVRIDQEILLIDAGLSFPTEEMHGVDIVIPDFTFLKENADKLKAIVVTHGHEDHVGALAYLLAELDVPVYGTELTLGLVKRKVMERFKPHDITLKRLVPGERIKIGNFDIEPIYVTHSIPDAVMIALHTENGIVLFTGDFKFDFTPTDGRLSDMARIGQLGEEGVLLLLSDSTNVENPGWCPSESSVYDGFKKIFSEAESRILITMFASNLHRVEQVMKVAHEFGRKVALAGRSMEQNVQIAFNMQRLRIPNDTMIKIEDCENYAPEELVILTTGAQGEPLAALSRMSRDEYHRLQIQPGDTVIYSARPIPGNEAAIWQTVNRLFRQGANVIYGPDKGVHVSGHAHEEEIKLLINLTKPNYIAPVHGEPRHQFAYAKLAASMGYDESNIILLENGNRLAIEKDGAFFREDVTCGRILVDSSGMPGVTDELLRDRSNLANDGVIFINVAIDPDAGKIAGAPVLVSRGVHSPNGDLDKLRNLIEDALSNFTHAELRDTAGVHHEVSDIARKYLKKSTNQRPLVVASVLEV